MNFIRKIVSCMTVVSVFALSFGSASAVSVIKNVDLSEKISAYLLEKYDGTCDMVQVDNEDRNSEKLPVLVWFKDDIDFSVVIEDAFPALLNGVATDRKVNNLSVTDKEQLANILESMDDISSDSIQNFIETERLISRRMYEKLNGEAVKKYMSDMDVTYISKYSPVVIANLSLEEVTYLAQNEATLEFAYYGNRNENADELDVSTVVSGGKLVQNSLGYTGHGVKIGQIDGCVADVNNIQLSSNSANIHINSGGFIQPSFHATEVACMLVGKCSGNFSAGMATDADLYSTSVYKYDDDTFYHIEHTEWLITNGVNVINASIAFGDDADNTYGTYARWLDHIAINHCVTFVKSAGNNGSYGVSSGGMAYNIITVGNIDDRNTLNLNDDILYSTSSYYSANTHLAYKPDICAPGTNIVTSASSSGMTGTSAAAPHVTGTVALMFEARPSLKIFPEVVKAILTASVNPNSNHRYCVGDWTSNSSVDSYAKFGSGLVDAYHATQTSCRNNYLYGTVSSSNTEDLYTINVPTSGLRVRVSMAFNKNNTITTSPHSSSTSVISNQLADLDLWVVAPDNSTVWKSQSYYNNVENVEFTAMQTGSYKIYVKMIPVSNTGTIQYGLAWMEE